MIQQTSLINYEQIKPELGKRQQQIYSYFCFYVELTNLELSQKSGLPINQVTPRVLELRQAGLIERKGVKTINNRPQIVWGLVSKTRQMEMF